jgi:hypothetical protein
MGGSHIVRAVLSVYGPRALRDEHFDRLPQQLLYAVAEELFGQVVDEPDAATAVDYHGGVRGQLHQRFNLVGNISAAARSWLGGSGFECDGRTGGASVTFRGAHRSAILSRRYQPNCGADQHRHHSRALCGSSELPKTGSELLTEHDTTWHASLSRAWQVPLFPCVARTPVAGDLGAQLNAMNIANLA